MATLVCVLKKGGRYDGRWVERLASGVRRNAPGFDRIACLTDLPLDLSGVDTIALREGWAGWWSKMEAFRPGLFSGTVVLCDLDTVFAAPADALCEPGLAAMEDHFHKGRLSTALMRWEGDEMGTVFEQFAARPHFFMTAGSCGAVPNAVHGDQVVVDHLMRHRGGRPRFFQDAYPGLIHFYDPLKTTYGPIVVFIGDAKPDRAGESIRSLWLGSGAGMQDGPACAPIRSGDDLER